MTERFNDYLETIRNFTDEELIPGEAEMTRLGAVPTALMERIAALGLFGITVPAEYGGSGRTMLEQVRLTMEFTRASLVYRSRFSTTIGLASQLLLTHGTKSQQEAFLPRMVRGECVTAFSLTEPEAGSDAGSLRTRAERTTDGYVLNGSKRFITNAGWADLFMVVARTDAASTGGDGTSVFLVDADTPGMRVEVAEMMNGHEAGPIGVVDLEDVHVPADRLLGEVEGGGLIKGLRGINHARTHVAASSVGQADRLLAEARDHVQRRRQFDAPLAELEVVQAELGRSFAELEAARAMVLRTAQIIDDIDQMPYQLISATKLYCTEMVGRLSDRCLQLLGGDGIVGDHPIPRMWRDVRALRIYEGASPIHERNLGRYVVRSESGPFRVLGRS